MDKKNNVMMKIMPWALIIFGVLLLFYFSSLPAIIPGSFILVGIVMLIERKWPEKWGTDE